VVPTSGREWFRRRHRRRTGRGALRPGNGRGPHETTQAQEAAGQAQLPLRQVHFLNVQTTGHICVFLLCKCSIVRHSMHFRQQKIIRRKQKNHARSVSTGRRERFSPSSTCLFSRKTVCSCGSRADYHTRLTLKLVLNLRRISLI
jgi:hypothetical protein